jgi:hypothetical protein
MTRRTRLLLLLGALLVVLVAAGWSASLAFQVRDRLAEAQDAVTGRGPGRRDPAPGLPR